MSYSKEFVIQLKKKKNHVYYVQVHTRTCSGMSINFQNYFTFYCLCYIIFTKSFVNFQDQTSLKTQIVTLFKVCFTISWYSYGWRTKNGWSSYVTSFIFDWYSIEIFNLIERVEFPWWGKKDEMKKWWSEIDWTWQGGQNIPCFFVIT